MLVIMTTPDDGGLARLGRGAALDEPGGRIGTKVHGEPFPDVALLQEPRGSACERVGTDPVSRSVCIAGAGPETAALWQVHVRYPILCLLFCNVDMSRQKRSGSSSTPSGIQIQTRSNLVRKPQTAWVTTFHAVEYRDTPQTIAVRRFVQGGYRRLAVLQPAMSTFQSWWGIEYEVRVRVCRNVPIRRTLISGRAET